MKIGYTLMCEQAGPRQLVRDAVAAEEAGFDFEVMSDHYFPWLDEQGHAPYAWSVLGAVAHATSTVDLMSYVTCPIKRYHPAVVAQKAATIALLSEGRFTPRLGQRFDEAGGSGKARVGQMPVSFDRDRDRAVDRAHNQFRWFAGGWTVNAELPGTAGFGAATQFVTADDVAHSIPCGEDTDAIVTGAKEWENARFTHLALVQIGGDHQDDFLEWAQSDLLPALRR